MSHSRPYLHLIWHLAGEDACCIMVQSTALEPGSLDKLPDCSVPQFPHLLKKSGVGGIIALTSLGCCDS